MTFGWKLRCLRRAAISNATLEVLPAITLPSARARAIMAGSFEYAYLRACSSELIPAAHTEPFDTPRKTCLRSSNAVASCSAIASPQPSSSTLLAWMRSTSSGSEGSSGGPRVAVYCPRAREKPQPKALGMLTERASCCCRRERRWRGVGEVLHALSFTREPNFIRSAVAKGGTRVRVSGLHYIGS